MHVLLEDGIVIDVELGGEGAHVVTEAARVGAAAGVGKSELVVEQVVAKLAPVALAVAVLLCGLVGVGVGEGGLAKVFGHARSAVEEFRVVLVGAGH